MAQYCNTLADHYKDIFIHHIQFNYIILNDTQYNLHKGYKMKINEDVMNLPKSILSKNLSHSNLPTTPESKFNDIILTDNSFKRTLDNKTLFYKNGQVDLLFKKINNLKYMKTLKPSKRISHKIMTLDIETYLKHNFHIPYCISLYYETINEESCNQFAKSFISTDSSAPSVDKDVLFNELFEYLFQPCFHNYIIYIHNSSKLLYLIC